MIELVEGLKIAIPVVGGIIFFIAMQAHDICRQLGRIATALEKIENP